MCMMPSEGTASNTKLVHFEKGGDTCLIYQLEAQSVEPGANAIVFTIPMSPTRENLEFLKSRTVDTTNFPFIAQNMVETKPDLQPLSRAMCFVGSFDDDEDGEAISYDCGAFRVVASDLRVLNRTLTREVPEAKRPSISDEFIRGIQMSGRSDFTVVCFCFSGTDAKTPPPVMIFYRQDLLKGKIVLPGIDAHNGGPPQLGIPVATDHAIAVGADHLPEDVIGELAGTVKYQDLNAMPDWVRELLPKRVMMVVYEEMLLNGDFVIDAQNPIFQTGRYSDGRIAYQLLRNCFYRLGQIDLPAVADCSQVAGAIAS